MKGHFLRIALLAVPLALYGGSAARGQETVSTVTTVVSTLLDRIELHGYAHAGYVYQDDGDETTSSFNLKRALLWGKANITDRWFFQFMYDFSSEVQEYYCDYRFSKGKQLNVRFGQFKCPYSIENPMSPRYLELINVFSQAVAQLAGGSGDPIYGKNYGRDLGIMVYGDLFNAKIHYEIALMNGQGINCSDGNSDKDVLLKIEWHPVSELKVVASGRKGRGHAVGTAEWNPDIEVGDNYTRDRLSFGAVWTDRRWGIRSEWLWGKDGNVKSWGAYMTGKYTATKDFDVIASVDFFDRNTKMKYDQTNVTAGVQYWFYKNCRIQLQYTRLMPQYEDDYNMVQAQIQVGF